MGKRIFKSILGISLLLLFSLGQPMVAPKPVFATVADNYEPVKLTGNGTTVDFSFGWALIAETNIRVYLEVITTGVQTLQTLNTDYTVSFDDDIPGGTVTFTTAPAATNYVIIARAIGKTQAVPLTTSSGFQAKVVEAMFDKATTQTQDVQEQVNRALKTKFGGTEDIEVAEPVANKALKWDATGTKIENSEDDLDDIVDDAQAAEAAALVSQNAAASSASSALSSKNSADADAIQTAADRVQTGLDRVATGQDKIATAADRVQTGLDAIATAADRVQTGLDKTATSGYKDTATTQAGIATTQAGLATTAKNDAVTAKNSAETAQGLSETARDAAQNYAAALKSTSTSSLTIGTGSKTFTTQSGKQFAAGQYVIAVSDADPANYMHGQVTSYSSTSLVVNVIDIGGSGTLADWTISISGSRGATGATGAAGSIPIATAAGTVDAITADYTPDTALSDLTVVSFVASGANTSTTPTFAPDGLTAHTITKQGGSALLAGDIPASGFVAIVEYNLANTRWELLNPSSKAYADTKTTLAAAQAVLVKNDGTVNPTNLLSNGNFENWTAGASAAPDGWGLGGADATISRASGGKISSYTPLITRAGTDCYLYQNFHTLKGIDYWKSRKVTLSVWAYCSTASRVRIALADGVSTYYSSYHTGDSTWQLLSVTATINSSATIVGAYLWIDTGNAQAYFDGAICVEGESAFAFNAKPVEEEGAWTNYLSSSTVTGYTGATSGFIYYKKMGRTVFFTATIEGTSNSTDFTFTMPYTAATGVDYFFGNGADNGSATLTLGLLNGTNVMQCNKGSYDASHNNWTNTGIKCIRITGCYEASS